MDNRNNTIAGWVLFAGICALGLTIGSSMLFASHNPEKPGYPIEDAEAGAGGGESAVPLANLLAAADPAKGEAVFAKCAACHTINSGGANGIGPNLFGAMGKPHGHVPGFAYSDALKGVAGNWDFEGMNAWITSPRKYAPGTKMSFAGLSSPEDRANLIVYLNSQGSNLPLPAAEAAPAPAPADGAAAAEGAAAAPTEGAAPAAGAPAAAAPAPAEAKK
ncbi:cytochrome C [Sphingopyxis sp. Root214]|uniref:c-type cytochrome n=1 Tax=unclassified Sphingopyxis TaxID=2614943 RepID=UPI0006F94176|nr:MULTISPECIES: cytochrome c family protein [unclassified Sphingopyxis]KQZ73092.1 cytochrome C [Sphingopyxis sp. Root154]KRC07239.1 cytochrome C [Sphingopyxis sp. Root214]